HNIGRMQNSPTSESRCDRPADGVHYRFLRIVCQSATIRHDNKLELDHFVKEFAVRISLALFIVTLTGLVWAADQGGPPLVMKPDAFKTLVNPDCSHCKDEAKRRAGELKDEDRVLCWVRDTKGQYNGGAIPFRFFLNPYRVISDSYGVFVYDPDAGFSRGF